MISLTETMIPSEVEVRTCVFSPGIQGQIRALMMFISDSMEFPPAYEMQKNVTNPTNKAL